jgi:hypothetical protein
LFGPPSVNVIIFCWSLTLQTKMLEMLATNKLFQPC